METNVLIRNEMPTSITCMGSNYAETCDLAMGDVTLFIERDLHNYLKKIPVLDPEFSVTLIQHAGIAQIRVSLEINRIKASIPLHRRVENILWAYNHQVFRQHEGTIVGDLPRFEFYIEISGRDEVRDDGKSSGGAYEQCTA